MIPDALWSINLGWFASSAWAYDSAFHESYQWGMWFRVFGYGLLIRKRAGHKPLFSERYGHRKPLIIGPVKVYGLAP